MVWRVIAKPFDDQEICSGLWQITAPMGERTVRWNVLIDADDGYSLVDAGLPENVCSWLDSGKAPKGPLRQVIFTHADADHIGDGYALQKIFPQAEFLAHARDRAWIENHDQLIRERYDHARTKYGYGYSAEVLLAMRAACGEDFRITGELSEGDLLIAGGRQWNVLHLPGHSPGHICLWCAEHGVLIAGDVVLGEGPPDAEGHPSMPPTHQFIADYLETIARLRALPVKVALTAHWPPMDGAEFQRFLDTSETVVHRDLRTIRDARAEGITGFAELLGILNKAHAKWPESEYPHYSYALAGYLEFLNANE